MKLNNIYRIATVSAIALFALAFTSCKEDKQTGDGVCKVTLVTRINPTMAGDTLRFEVKSGELMQEVPELTKQGFTFGGWYTDAASANKTTGKASFAPYDLSEQPIYLDVILYARWLK